MKSGQEKMNSFALLLEFIIQTDLLTLQGDIRFIKSQIDVHEQWIDPSFFFIDGKVRLMSRSTHLRK